MNNRFKMIVSIIGLLAIYAGSSIADVPLVTTYLDKWGDFSAIALLDDYMLVGVKDHGLEVMDISNPDAMESVALINEYGDPVDIVVADTLAFILFQPSGLGVFDIRDPENISVVIEPSRNTHDGPEMDHIEWQPPYLVVCSVHISGPRVTDPTVHKYFTTFRWTGSELEFIHRSYILGEILVGPAIHAAVMWPDLYYAGDFRMQHYRWSADTEEIELIEAFDRWGEGPLQPVGEYLYSGEYGDMVIYQPDDTGALVPIDSLNIDHASDAFVKGDTLVVLKNYYGISNTCWFVDISSPDIPTIVESRDLLETDAVIDLKDDQFVEAYETMWLRLYNADTWDIEGELHPDWATINSLHSWQNTIVANADVIDSTITHYLVDVSNPGGPVVSDEILATPMLLDVYFDNGLYYATTWYHNKLLAYDLRDLTNPEVSFTFEDTLVRRIRTGVMLSDTTISTSFHDQSYQHHYSLLNISSPEPVLGGDIEYFIREKPAYGRYIANTDWHSQFDIVDILDLQHPEVLASIVISGFVRILDLQLVDDIVSVIWTNDEFYGNQYLTAYRMEGWDNPVQLYTVLLGDGYPYDNAYRKTHATRYGQYFLFYDTVQGLLAYDLLGSEEPVVLLSPGNYELGKPVVQWPYMTISENHWVAVYDVSDVLTVDAEEASESTLPTTITLAPAYPNPFNAGTMISFTLPHAMQARVTVYDILGRQVRLLQDGIQQAGEQKVFWDGRSSSGGTVASGTYLLRLDTGKEQFTRRVVLVK